MHRNRSARAPYAASRALLFSTWSCEGSRVMAKSEQGRGFAQFGLLVGAAAGFAAHLIIANWVDPASWQAAPLAALAGLGAFAGGLLLLAEKGDTYRAVVPAGGIGLVLALATWNILGVGGQDPELSPWPRLFWLLAGMPIAGYLMTTLAKAALGRETLRGYGAVFFHGLTLPIIAGGAVFFAGLSLVLLYAWAGLLKSFDVDFFHRLFQEPWFIFPFVGSIIGLAISLIRGLDSALGGVRFLLLLLARILAPITAVFSLTFALVLALKGTDPIFATPYPGAIMIALAFVGMLVFNGVYQNGESEPPPAWLRLSTIAALAALPIYAGLAAFSFWMRIAEYGLTPPRIIGLAIIGLAALYSVVCVCGLLTDLNWRAVRWMPLVGPLNVSMAFMWIATIVFLASPGINLWALSAKSQEERLINGRISAEAFDYGYLRFSLGGYGRAALERLAAIDNHPESAAIRAGAERALAAENRYYFDNPSEGALAPSGSDLSGDSPIGSGAIEDIPLNPGIDDFPDEPRTSDNGPDGD